MLKQYVSHVILSQLSLSIPILLSLQVADVPEDILKIKKEVEAEFFGEEQNWGRSDAHVSFFIMVIAATCVRLY